MAYREKIYSQYGSVPVGSRASAAANAGSERDHGHYLRGWLPSRGRALDIGCGAGALVHFLLNQGLEVRGVDRSQEQVDSARGAGLPCELGDGLLALRRHRSDLDLVTAFDLIEHLSKDEVIDFLSAAHEALFPGGLLILKCPNCTTPFGIGIRYGDFTHEVGLTTGSIAHLLRLAGFQAIEFRETGPYPHGLKSAIRTVAWKVLRTALIAWDYVETGGSESPVRTRVMLVRARKLGA